MYQQDLALNDSQVLICHKTKQNHHRAGHVRVHFLGRYWSETEFVPVFSLQSIYRLKLEILPVGCQKETVCCWEQWKNMGTIFQWGWKKILPKNMQKLPEALDRKRDDTCAKKRNHPDKRKNLVLFQYWPAEWQHLNLSC